MHDPFGLVGTTLDRRYRVIRAVAEGGFGVVYEAEAVALATKVALKVLRTTAIAEARARFEQEARLLARLRHPAIVALTDAACLDDGTPYLVLEWLDGETLDEVLARRGTISVDECAAMLGPVVSAIAFAHAQGVVHRDLKPSNLMVTENGMKVLDFGIARWSGDLAVKTATGAAAGVSFGFAAPEQYGKELGAVDGRTDQFALAAIVFAMLTGHAPFAADTPAEVMFATCVSQTRPSPRSLRPELPVAIDEALRRALSIRPEERFASIGEFWAQIAPNSSPLTLPAQSPPVPSPPVATEPRLADLSQRGSMPIPITLPSPIAGDALKPAAIALTPPTTHAPSTAHSREPTGTLRQGHGGPPSSDAPRSRGGGSVVGVLMLIATIGSAGAAASYWLLDGRDGKHTKTSPSATAKPKPIASASTSATTKPSASMSSSKSIVTCDERSPREACVRATRFRRGPSDCGKGIEDDAHKGACPAEQVNVASFAIDRDEVTRAHWDECVGAKKCRALESDEPPATPVRSVSFDDAVTYCKWDGGRRLPTDDEWELAAAGSQNSEFPWGNDAPAERLAVYSEAADARIAPLATGSDHAGDTPTGISDLAGNVAEWTSSIASDDAPIAEGAEGAEPSNGVGNQTRRWVRGGSFASPWFELRTWVRQAWPDRTRSPRIGFRCAKSVAVITEKGAEKGPNP